MSTLATNSLTNINGTGTITLPTGNVLRGTDAGSIYCPGSIVQVVNNFFSTTSALSVPAGYTTFTDIPSFVATIAPKFNTSTILIQARWFGEFADQTPTWDAMFGVKRNGVAVGYPPSTGASQGITLAAASYYANDGSSTPETMNLTYVDSPATTSSITYQICICATAAHTLYTNRTVGSPGPAGYEFGTSMLTLMEIGA
jgi:hypothetical protein